MNNYLAPGLPAPVPSPDGLETPFWDGLRDGQLLIQRCQTCARWQWGPEWVCHRCHSFDLAFEQVEPHGVIYSYERVWHPVHPALSDQGPFLIGLVELPHADQIRLVGNIVGDPHQDIAIGAPVTGTFEHHPDHDPAYSLLHWRLS